MSQLEDVSADELRSALESISEKKPALRLVAAIAYKNGVTQTELSAWFGVERKTIYNWFQRIEDGETLVDAVTDDPRPGRPRKLSRDDQRQLADDLDGPPDALGYDESEWTPTLLQAHVESAFGESYSLPSCRRLLREFQSQ